MDSVGEHAVRQQIMHALSEMAAETGFVTRAQLSATDVGDSTRRLIDTSKGIWNPRDLAATLTVVSSPDGPYDDRQVDGAMFRYDYRAGSTEGDNTKLRRAYELDLPIILLRKIAASVYAPVFPVYVVGDDRDQRQFLLALDESVRFLKDPLNPSPAEHRYAERVVKQRLHQSEFRGRVMRAYDVQCAVCNLRHGRLLDAAHITADSAVGGDPVVTNGLSLCRIHHGAYDGLLLGISPDYVVHIDQGLLAEKDGPMLLHGLQEMDGRTLTIPKSKRDRPDRDRLEARFADFTNAIA